MDTSENRPFCDNRKTFYQAVKGILEQGRRCVDHIGSCRYRINIEEKPGSYRTLACIAGQLIPDEDYQKSWDDEILTATQYPICDYFIAHGHDPEFVRSLQRLHDSAHMKNFVDYVKSLLALSIAFNFSDSQKIIEKWLKDNVTK